MYILCVTDIYIYVCVCVCVCVCVYLFLNWHTPQMKNTAYNGHNLYKE